MNSRYPRLSGFLLGLLVAFFGSTFSCDVGAQSPRDRQSERESVHFRGNLDNAKAVFTSTGKGTVAFIGGSITEMDGYRPMVMKALEARFPATEFRFVNAGIASTCSHSGAFRLPKDVLAAKPDLLLVEFAVNDDQDAAHSYEDAVKGMEGVIRSARRELPNLDIVITHFVNPPMLETVNRGVVPLSIRAHEAVASRYDLSTCNVAVELANQIAAGTTTWKIYGGVHPKPAGNRIAADLVERVFDEAGMTSERVVAAGTPSLKAHTMPEPVDPKSFWRGRFLEDDAVRLGKGWKKSVPTWESIPGSMRSRFVGVELSHAEQPNAELEASFSGTAFGLYALAGPDAGVIEFSFDDGPWQSVDLYHRFSKRLHYPRTVVLASDLEDGEHRVRIRTSSEKNPKSLGNAIRVLQFVAS